MKLQTLAQNEVFRQYFVKPLTTFFTKKRKYFKTLLHAHFRVSLIQADVASANPAASIKDSRAFFLTSIAFSFVIVSVVAFIPKEEAASRIEVVQQLALDLLKLSGSVFAFGLMGTISWVVLRPFRSQLGLAKYFSLLAYFVGGPVIVFFSLVTCIEFGAPFGFLSRHFTSVFELEGALGLILVLVCMIYLVVYFWPYLKVRRVLGCVVLCVSWNVAQLGFVCAESVILGQPIWADVRESLTEHKFLRTSEIVRLVAEVRLKYLLAAYEQTGQPPTAYNNLLLEPTFDDWNRSVIVIVFTYTAKPGDMRPYILAISKGPNGVLDFSESDLIELDRRFRTQLFPRITDVDALIDSIMEKYDPVRIPDQEAQTRAKSPFNSDSWAHVDIYGSMGTNH